MQAALQAVPGVRKASVKFATGKARVSFDPSKTSVKALIEAVEGAGFMAEAPP